MGGVVEVRRGGIKVVIGMVKGVKGRMMCM
jgi:hypothetical protein